MITDLHEHPDEIMHLLSELERVLAPSFQVTLAGGFLRDSFGHVDFKDIDILVTPTEAHPVSFECLVPAVQQVDNLVCGLINPDLFTKINMVDGSYVANMDDRGVDGVILGGSNEYNIEVQLIVYSEYKSRIQLAHDMDINICQIVMSPIGHLYASPAFVSGFKNQEIITLNPREPGLDHTRRLRMIDKYPEFKVVEPLFTIKETVSDLSKRGDYVIG